MSIASATASPRSRTLRERMRDREERNELLLFHVGRERFALELTAVDEVVDMEGIPLHPVPGESATLLGVVELRGALLPLHSAAALLGIGGESPRVALVLPAPTGAGKLALGVGDAEDVLTFDLAQLRPAPHQGGMNDLLLGVLQQGKDLIGVLDGDALAAGCRADPSLETS